MRLNKSRRFISAVILVMLVFALTACGNKKQTIVGTWELTNSTLLNISSDEYIFKQDGTGTYTPETLSPMQITYTVEDSHITIKMTVLGIEKIQNYDYKLESGKLYLTTNGIDKIYEKK